VVNLAKKKDEIYSELINPLFLKTGINVRDEDNPRKHRKNNLFCLYEDFLRELRQIEKKGDSDKFKSALRKFHADYKKILPSVIAPFSWMLDMQRQTDQTLLKLRQEFDELVQKQEGIDKKRAGIIEDIFEKSLTQDWRRIESDKENVETKIDLLKKERFELGQKLELAIRLSERSLNWLKEARGRPGRHPKPFNVLVYHLINKCTFWKLDENRKFIYREDGQHKFERDWRLILLLILYFYIRLEKKVELPELKKFISKYGKKSAQEALKILKERLLNIYKNFPPKDGWPFPRKISETGFRKLIITDDGKFDIIKL
jgi:hypothetical protein